MTVPASEVSGIESLYVEHAPRLIRTAWLMCGSRPLAEDIVQEAFLRLSHHDGDMPDHPGAYLRQMVVNGVRDTRRHDRVARRHGRPIPEPVLQPDDHLVWDLFQALTAQQRQVLVLRYFEDMTIPQIARLLDRPEGRAGSTGGCNGPVRVIG